MRTLARLAPACLFALGCATFPRPYPVWVARVRGDTGTAISGSFMVLQRGGALASMSVNGTIPKLDGPTNGWAEWTVSDGGQIVSATFINSGLSPEIRGEILRDGKVIASGSAKGRFATLLLNPP